LTSLSIELAGMHVTGQTLLIVVWRRSCSAASCFLFFDFTLTGKALRATVGQPDRRAPDGDTAGARRDDRLSARIADGRRLRHPDRAGEYDLLRFWISCSASKPSSAPSWAAMTSYPLEALGATRRQACWKASHHSRAVAFKDVIVFSLLISDPAVALDRLAAF